MAFAKLKTLLRTAAERTQDDLWNRIGCLLECSSQTSAQTTFVMQDTHHRDRKML
jgi:hypothetical protein